MGKRIHSVLLPLGLVLILGACTRTDRRAHAEGTSADAGAAETSLRDLDRGPERHITHLPETIQWQPAPPSLPPGAQVAVLEGDPGASGFFTMRIRMPDGYRIEPHWHPNVERVTVLSGMFRLGSAPERNRQTEQLFTPGSYTSMPRRMVHYAVAEGDTEIQLSSIGPWEIHYVNPQDDPRNQPPSD